MQVKENGKIGAEDVLRLIVCLNETLADFKLRLPHYRALLLAKTTPGVTPTEIREKLKIFPAAVTRLTDALVKAGLLRREVDNNDRRKIQCHLTEEALSLLNAIDEQILSL